MPRSPSTTLPVFPLCFALPCVVLLGITPSLLCGQAANSGQAQNSPSSSSSSQPSGSPQKDQPPAPVADPIPANAERISRQTRFEIIRTFETQLVYSRTTFPMNTKGLRLRGDVITPNGEDLRQALLVWGPAIRPGDPAHISLVQIKDDHIRFEINGGPIRRKKWYKHVQISGSGGTVTPGGDEPQTNPHGSFVDVYFSKYVPEMTAQQVRALLYPVFDFNARNKEQAYLDTVPPKAKEAIQAHRVLVGMNTEMVVHARGKPPRKVRERDGETEYEEWIYGEAPADVDFVRIVDDEVVRVETMKVSGEKIVRTDKEITLPRPEGDRDKEAKQDSPERPANAPSLRRPGEDTQDLPKPADGPAPLPPPPPTLPPNPGSGPGQMVGTQ